MKSLKKNILNPCDNANENPTIKIAFLYCLANNISLAPIDCPINENPATYKPREIQ